MQRGGTLRPTIGGNVNPVGPDPGTELHLWHAALDRGDWPRAESLPEAERERAADIVRDQARKRWVASRWALRGVLGGYLGREPAEVELSLGERGKPRLADAGSALRFNLSHSKELALVAIATGREVGVDVQWIGSRPVGFYAGWTRREAITKCHGVGLAATAPETPVAIASLDLGPRFAATVAVASEEVPPLRHFSAEPG